MFVVQMAGYIVTGSVFHWGLCSAQDPCAGRSARNLHPLGGSTGDGMLPSSTMRFIRRHGNRIAENSAS